MKIRTIIFFVMLCSLLNYGQEFKKTATAGFVFLQLPVTARSASLGESSVALADMGSGSFFTNPAGMGFNEKQHSFSASYSPWIADIKHYAAAYSLNTDFGVIALGALAVDYGTMPKTKRTAGQKVYEVLGNFSANALAVGLSYSRALTDKFSFGVTVKYVREGIDDYSASNILFDGGVLYYTGLSSLRIGASIQNFGVETKYINDPFKMPSVLKLGLAAELLGDMKSEYRVTGIVEALHPNDGDEKMNAGLEVGWKNMIFLRGGYKFFYDEETWSFGVGLTPSAQIPVGVDFSFADYGRLGNILRFTLNLNY
ncbi:MAG: PorV/PorQ family protein [Ignavibacteria bacterium]|nr:PorV/PorQ family protein [Ignavibacteria bacterium]